ncbi:MAG: VOC family protein [Acidimicrobiales bacterium]|nr:VOC family protein [Acidimicrobiales bacterium]
MTLDRIEFLSSRPSLEVRDLGRSIAFYQQVLGWRALVTTGEPPTFALVGVDRPLLALAEAAEPAVAGIAACYVDVVGVEALAARCGAEGVEIVAPLTDHPWGMRDLVVRDPDGHLVALGEQVERRGLDL